MRSDTRTKAPIVTPTGCPVCCRMGIPGTSCATCLEAAHGAAVRATSARLREALHRVGPDSLIALTTYQHAEAARAAWAGCNVLVDCLGVLLVRVGFEVPSLVRLHGPEARS